MTTKDESFDARFYGIGGASLLGLAVGDGTWLLWRGMAPWRGFPLLLAIALIGAMLALALASRNVCLRAAWILAASGILYPSIPSEALHAGAAAFLPVALFGTAGAMSVLGAPRIAEPSWRWARAGAGLAAAALRILVLSLVRATGGGASV